MTVNNISETRDSSTTSTRKGEAMVSLLTRNANFLHMEKVEDIGSFFDQHVWSSIGEILSITFLRPDACEVPPS